VRADTAIATPIAAPADLPFLSLKPLKE